MTEIAPEVVATHRDRPTAKVQLPFVVIGGRHPLIEYSYRVDEIKEGSIKMSIPMSHSISQPVLELQRMFCEVQAERDGHLKQIDDLTTENLLLKRQVEEAGNKAKYAERKKENGK